MSMIVKFKEARLLTKEEFEELMPGSERNLGDAWWLCESSEDIGEDGCNTAYAVNEDGSEVTDHDVDLNHYVRPVLVISTNLIRGDVFHLDGLSFLVIGGGRTTKLAIADTAICRSPFREAWYTADAGRYDVSDVKKIVDAWYSEKIEGRERNIIYENRMLSASILSRLQGLCETASDGVYVSSDRVKGILDDAVALSEKICEYLETDRVTRIPQGMPDERPRKDPYMDVPHKCRCDVQEIINWHYSDYKDKLVKTHHVEAGTRRELCEKVYAFERSSRYDSARRYQIVEKDIQSLYTGWKNNGGITMKMYYGSGVVD